MTHQKERIYRLIDRLDAEQVDALQQLLVDWLEKGKGAALAEARPVYPVAEQVEHDERTAADLTVRELENVVYLAVLDALRDSSPIDPDAGLELREEFIEELRQSIAEEEAGETFTFEEVKAEFGLD